MTKLDDKLRTALRSQLGDDTFDDDREASLLDDVFATFRGRGMLLNIGSTLVGTVFVGLSVWLALKLLRATDAREAVVLATGLMFCCMVVVSLKVWFWLEMQRNSIIRELKRVELLIARSMEARGPKP